MTEPGTERAVPLWNIANILTMVRLVLVPVFIVLFLQGTTGTRWAAAIVFVLAAITDKLDGYLARSRNLVTDFGKLADPIADKALVISALVVLSLAGELPWWITVVIVVRELGITLLRDVMQRRGVVMPASRGGKLKAVLQFVFVTLLLVPWRSVVADPVADVIEVVTWVIVGAAVLVTLVTGIQYLVEARTAVRSGRTTRR